MLRQVKLVYILLLVILVVPAASTLLFQHHYYENLGHQQNAYMQAFVKLAPQLVSNTTVIVIDDTPEHGVATTFNNLNGYFDTMLQIIYADSTLKGIFCYSTDTASIRDFDSQCHFEVNQMTLTSKARNILSRRYDQLVVYRYDSQQGLQLEYDLSLYGAPQVAQLQYNPDSHVNNKGSLPLRAYTMLGLTH